MPPHGWPGLIEACLASIAILWRSQSAPPGTGVEKAPDGRKQFRLVEQEGIVTFIAFDLDERDVGGDGVERLDDLAVVARRIEPVGRE